MTVIKAAQLHTYEHTRHVHTKARTHRQLDTDFKAFGRAPTPSTLDCNKFKNMIRHTVSICGHKIRNACFAVDPAVRMTRK